jgi:23S rRNA pseudouridine2605 synthase
MSTERKPERLHKVLAHSGVASRRRCEDLIRDGRVRVNGKIVKEMGVLVDPEKDEVQVDDERLIHLLLYKPKDVLCTTSDQFGRKTILDLLPEHRGARLFTVGRLDFESEGLVVVTNDGEFANEILHPRRRLPRTYWVKVRGHVTQEALVKAREGVWLSDGRTPPMDVRLLRAGREISTVKCTLVERHHHQLRRIWAKLMLPALRLVLVRIASVGTEDLKKGAWRTLTPDEVAELRSGAPGQLEESGRAGPRRGPRTERRQGRGRVAGRGRDERGAARGRDERGGSRGRDERGGSRGRDERGAARGRDDRGGSRGRDDRGGSRGRDERGGSRGRDERGGSSGWGAPAEGESRKARRGPSKTGRGQRGFRAADSSSSSGVRFRKRGR